jgi:DNA polymerase III epsilon subunit-like protein
MPDYLPMNQVRLEMSSFGSNKWMYKSNPLSEEDFNIGEERLKAVEKIALGRSYCGYKIPFIMDEPIIEGGLKVLESKQKSEMERKKNAYQHEIKEELGQMKRRQEKIEKKLDQLLNLKFGRTSF